MPSGISTDESDTQQPQQPQLRVLAAQCVAAEAQVGRSGAGLLAWVPGTQLLVAAAGSHLLLLRATATGAQPVALLWECPASITAVAVSGSRGRRSCSGSANASGGSQQRWAAVLAGSSAHLVPFSVSGVAAALGPPGSGSGSNSGSSIDRGSQSGSHSGGGSGSSNGSPTSFEAPCGTQGWQACAWHLCRPVCALAAPQQLLLVSPASTDSPVAAEASSSSSDSDGSRCATEGSDGGSSHSGVLVAVPAPGSGSTCPWATAGHCCLAWLDCSATGSRDGGRGSRSSSCWGRLVASCGTHLELLAFGSGWQLLERRQLLLGLTGPVRGLAASGAHRLLVTTEQPLGSWLGQGDQQHGGAQQAEEEEAGPRVLLRGLQAAAQRRQQEQQHLQVLPAAGGSAVGPGSGVWVSEAQRPEEGGRPAAAAPDAAAEEAGQPGSPPGPGVIDLTRRYSRSASAPPIPASFLLDLHGLRQGWGPMPLEAGLPALPLRPVQQAGGGVMPADGGQAALLWLADDTARCRRRRSSSSSRPHATQLGSGGAAACVGSLGSSGSGSGSGSPTAAEVAASQLASSSSSSRQVPLCGAEPQDAEAAGEQETAAAAAAAVPAAAVLEHALVAAMGADDMPAAAPPAADVPAAAPPAADVQAATPPAAEAAPCPDSRLPGAPVASAPQTPPLLPATVPALTDSAAAAPAAVAALSMSFAPDLLQLRDGLALLASTKRAAPAVVLCSLVDACGLRQQGTAALPLPLPAGIPAGSTVRIRGLALIPQADAHASGSIAGAAATADGRSQALVWALLACASKAATAPFLSAALAGNSSAQQLWLCCYSLRDLQECASAAAADAAAKGSLPTPAVSMAAGGQPTATTLQQERASAAALQQGEQASAVLQQQEQASAATATSAGAAVTPDSAVGAVLALQGEVAQLQREVNERLDRLSAQLSQLLLALQPP